jgi:OFA family oxalate/formate antiporter-like MFS transporter
MKNRWLIAASAVGIHICIGSVYAWSVVINPLISQFGWERWQISLAFSIAIFFLGASAATFGRFVEIRGPRASGTLSALCFGFGVTGAGLAIRMGNLPLLYLTYGALGGIGLGIGYIAPVSTLIKWFPDKRGMATGMAIMGFGFAALLSSPIMQMLIQKVGISNMFFILGPIYMTIMLCSAQYLSPPPKDWTPAGFHESIASGKKTFKKDLAMLTANESIKTLRFYYLWLMLCINITCGIALLSVASPLAQEVTGMTAMTAAAMVGLMGLFNGIGRIGWSSLSDHLGRPAVWTAFFVIEIAAYFFIPGIANTLLFQAVIFLIMTCYGGAFASVPAYISDIFGTKQVSAIHGYILTAWSTAGIVGPLLVAWARDATGSYTKTLYIFGCLFVVALITSLLMIANIVKLRKQLDVNPHHAPHAIETAISMPIE